MDTRPDEISHPHRVIARAAAVVGLLGVALIHLLDLQSKFHETPYLGVGYLALITAALGTAAALIHRDSRPAWLSTALISFGAVAGFVINRTVGLPGANEDIGNWLEPLGLAALFVETITVAVAAYALTDRATVIRARFSDGRQPELQTA
ncbi:MAG: hypothetical protein JF603_12235 [Acidobacteria bacterium]|nr:hypothetical protein [Acidobacteriota bacterium]